MKRLEMDGKHPMREKSLGIDLYDRMAFEFCLIINGQGSILWRGERRESVERNGFDPCSIDVTNLDVDKRRSMGSLSEIIYAMYAWTDRIDNQNQGTDAVIEI